MPKIEVDVARSRRARFFSTTKGTTERLWQDDLDRAAAMIAEHLEDLKTPSDPENTQIDTQPTLSIAIFGPAGSGKSSFLQTLVQDARNGDLYYQGDDQQRRNLDKIPSLDVLQPARFAQGDHLIYAFVAAALDAHREQQEKQGKRLDYDVLSRVLQSYRALADDLHAVHQEAPSPDLQPLELAAERVQRHTSGLRLRKKMAEFLDALAKDLGDEGSVILMPVDDLDLAPQHLYDSLRALQAYLLHPRLVPVFTFTDRQAEDILIGRFAENLGTIQRDRGTQQPVSQQLAIQYLAKCFPIRNRLRLGPAAAILQAADTISKKDGAQPEPTLRPLIAASKLLFGNPDRSARHQVHAALRPSTLRRQFQVIDSIRQAGVGELLQSAQRRTAWGLLFERNVWALINVHRDVLREYDLYLEDLYSWSPTALRRVLLRALGGTDCQTQVGLWERWHSLTDSRRSQVISLLVAQAHRPWMEGEPPAGDDLQSVLLWKKAYQARESGGLTHGRDPDEVEASLIVLWFINAALGFYLPFSWSVYHEIKPPKRPRQLGGAGWSLLSAPTHAAQIAHDDRKIFSTGMMFLDPLSYAIALTTAARIAACAVLDERAAEAVESSADGQGTSIPQLPLLKDVSGVGPDTAKRLSAQGIRTVEQLANSSIDMVCAVRGFGVKRAAAVREAAARLLEECEKEEAKQGKEEKPQPPWPIRRHKLTLLSERTGQLHESISQFKDNKNASMIGTHIKKLIQDQRKAAADYQEVANWEIGNPECQKESEIQELLKARNYDEAYRRAKQKKLGDSVLDKILELKSTAAMVHDDQLLLRIWTCYGSDSGRYWAAVSLWRGLGLIGQLIEAFRTWKKKLEGDDDAEAKMIQNISGLLRTHCEKGLVPGMDLGGPNPGDTLQLAFSEWNTLGQRRAIWRLAARLRHWLEHIWENHKTSPQKQASRWSRCVVRRMHGSNIVSSFWAWLDAEHLEHQGRQYSKRRKYHWNAGLALTSWIRVLLRYFEHAYAERWIFETCPLVSPFLSHNARDPFLASLRELPYHELLMKNAKAAVEAIEEIEDIEDGVATGEDQIQPRYRIAEHFQEVTIALEEIWKRKGDAPQSLQELEKALLMKDSPLSIAKSRKREDVENLLNEILDLLLEPEKGLRHAPIFKDSSTSAEVLESTAVHLRRLLSDMDSGSGFDPGKYRSYLLRTFRPRIERRGPIKGERNDKRDILDSDSVRYEIVRMIYHHWKVAAHASTASLFYQLPGVIRERSYSDRGGKKKNAS